MPLHSSLTDPNLHEPKGAANASTGMVYVADGAGSGTWTYSPTGYVRYQNSGAAQVFTSTPQKLVINGAGPNSTEAYLPREIRGTGSLWDTVTNDVTPIAQGDAFVCRLSFPLTANTGSPTLLSLVLDIGATAGITIPIVEAEIPILKPVPYTVTTTINFDALDTFLANGGQFFVSVNTGTVTVLNPTIQVTRVHGEVM